MSSLRERIMHSAAPREYDAAARRARYLRERQLKGRQSAAPPPPPGWGDRPSDAPDKDQTKSPSPKAPPKPPASSTPVTPARIEALKVRLEQLRAVLDQLAGKLPPEPASTTSSKTKDDKSADAKPEKKTAAEKKEEAKKAKETREKEKPPTPQAEAEVIKAQIASVVKQIEDARAKLAAARKPAPQKKPPPPKKNYQGEEDDRKPPVKPPTASEGRHH